MIKDGRTERKFYVRGEGTAGSIAVAVAVVAFCAMVVGVCWAGAWLVVHIQ